MRFYPKPRACMHDDLRAGRSRRQVHSDHQILCPVRSTNASYIRQDVLVKVICWYWFCSSWYLATVFTSAHKWPTSQEAPITSIHSPTQTSPPPIEEEAVVTAMPNQPTTGKYPLIQTFQPLQTLVFAQSNILRTKNIDPETTKTFSQRCSF